VKTIKRSEDRISVIRNRQLNHLNIYNESKQNDKDLSWSSFLNFAALMGNDEGQWRVHWCTEILFINKVIEFKKCRI